MYLLKYIATALFLTMHLLSFADNVSAIQKKKMEEEIEKVFKKQLKTLAPKDFVSITTCEVENASRTVLVKMSKDFSDLSFTQKEIKAVKKCVSKALPKSQRKYNIQVSTCGIPIEELASAETTEPSTGFLKNIDYEGHPWVLNTSLPTRPSHALYNRYISLWASHGYYFDVNKGQWRWQRPALFGTTEDLYTLSIVNGFLIPMFENAGATVFTPRERDIQKNEIIIDNDYSPGSLYLEVNGRHPWKKAPLPGFKHHPGIYTYEENPFKAGSACMTKATKSKRRQSIISYQPTIPQAGKYAVYVSYQSLPQSVSNAKYTVWHKGERTTFEVNQQMGGGTWVYLGTFEFDKGYSQFNRVELTNQSDQKGVVTADAVRFGGGMGNIERGGSISQLPRHLEGARYYAQWAGMAPSIYNGRNGSNDYADDINTRSLMTNYMGGGSCYMPHSKGLKVPIELSLAIHSDAGYDKEGKELVGSLSICTTQQESTAERIIPRGVSKQLATTLLQDIQKDLSAIYGKWNTRSIYDRNYSETRLPLVPSTILETLSHQSFPDMLYGQHPEFKFQLARSIYKSISRFITQQHGKSFITQPLPPTHVDMRYVSEGELELQWKPQEDKNDETAHPNGYIIYMAYGQLDFDNGTYVHSATRHRIKLEPNVLYRFRIAAVNRGGISFKTPTYCAMYCPTAKNQVLIVDGFQRLSTPAVINTPLQQGFDLRQDPGVQYGATYNWLGYQQVFDKKHIGIETASGLGYTNDSLMAHLVMGSDMQHVATHAEAIQRAGAYSILSCSSDAFALQSLQLTSNTIIDLVLGLQKEDNYSRISYKTFPVALQKRLERCVQHGCNVLVSGAYLGCDMKQPAEKGFLSRILGIEHQGTYRDSSNVLYGMNTQFHFYNQLNEQHYPATSCDVIYPTSSAFTILTYSNQMPAAVAHQGAYKSISMGFPLECITTSEKRATIMKALLDYLSIK